VQAARVEIADESDRHPSEIPRQHHEATSPIRIRA
jgi:hypothetical protein